MRSFRYMADISSNNGAVDLKHYSEAGHAVLAIKATEGPTYTNPYHLEQCREAHALGMTVIHYHYCRPGRGNMKDELEHFRNQYRKGWRDGDYVCLDLEVRGSLTPDNLKKYAALFLSRLTQLGHPTILYSYKSFAEECLTGVRFKGNRWWLAKYSNGEPKLPHGLTLWAWQYSDGAAGPEPHFYTGIGKCDGSIVTAGPALALYVRKIKTRKVK